MGSRDMMRHKVLNRAWFEGNFCHTPEQLLCGCQGANHSKWDSKGKFPTPLVWQLTQNCTTMATMQFCHVLSPLCICGYEVWEPYPGHVMSVCGRIAYTLIKEKQGPPPPLEAILKCPVMCATHLHNCLINKLSRTRCMLSRDDEERLRGLPFFCGHVVRFLAEPCHHPKHKDVLFFNAQFWPLSNLIRLHDGHVQCCLIIVL